MFSKSEYPMWTQRTSAPSTRGGSSHAAYGYVMWALWAVQEVLTPDQVEARMRGFLLR